MSLSLYNSTIEPLSNGDIFLGREYDNILDFAEINISINCDTSYNLTYIYSQDKLTVDFEELVVVPLSSTTTFFNVPVKDRYFKLKIEATDGDMTVLNVQTIYKNGVTFQTSSTPASNVSITNPLNMDGSVRVGGDLILSGDVNANITNDELNVNIVNTENIGVLVNNTEPIPISNDKIDDLSFDAFNNLNININNVNPNFLTNNGLRVYNVSDVPIINSSTQTFLNVLDSTVNNNLVAVKNDITKANKLSSVLWASQLTGVAGVSLPVNLTSINQTNITIFGNVSGATNLIVQFSIDNTTYYDSQYSFNSSAGGDVGFNIQSSVNYVRVKSTNDITCTLFCSVN
jgi:hypothetical protein